MEKYLHFMGGADPENESDKAGIKRFAGNVSRITPSE